MVRMEITRKQYDYSQPWQKRPENFQKNGVVIESRLILTTADYLADTTLLRLQKSGRGKWWDGRIEWIDYHANLALVTVSDESFWRDLTALPLADVIPTRGEAELVRWREGQFEVRKADINRVHVQRSKLSFVEHLQLEVNCEAKGAGWSEAVVAGRKLLGITAAQEGSTCAVIPAPFIRSVLDARRKGNYRGLGYFDFVWQRSENPATHAFLSLAGEPKGVVVIEIPKRPGPPSPLQPHDILVRIDGFEIDTQGDFKDPVYGNQMLEGLATRNHWAGDLIKIQVWRKGQLVDLSYALPKAEYSTDLVPQAVFDQEIEYFVVGGLVFQPLTEPYLRSWGADWRRRVPFRLGYYTRDDPTPERPTLIVLSAVLPDPVNIGYQDYRYLAVNKVNGRKIRNLSDVAEAIQTPSDGFHVIEFDAGDSYRKMVLDATQTVSATKRVMERYRIEKDRHIPSAETSKR